MNRDRILAPRCADSAERTGVLVEFVAARALEERLATLGFLNGANLVSIFS